jgi:peptidyl-prolyl cis-trans isomerase C
MLRPSVAALAGLLLGAAPALADGEDPVVARVNGAELHRSDVLSMQKQLPAQMQQMPLEQIYPALLDQLVNGKLIAAAGRAAKLDEDPEVKRRLALYEDRLIQETYITREVEKASTDAKLRAKYDDYIKANPGKEEVSARHVLVASEPEAKAVIAELQKGGDFAAIAKAKSKDPGAQNGGDLGYFSREDMVPEFADAAFQLKKGEYTKEPVKTQFGWHVIKVEDKRTSAPPSFDEAKDELSDSVARDVINEKVKELRDKAKVETFAIDGSPKK